MGRRKWVLRVSKIASLSNKIKQLAAAQMSNIYTNVFEVNGTRLVTLWFTLKSTTEDDFEQRNVTDV